MKLTKLLFIGLTVSAFAVACGDDDEETIVEPPEVITTVNLTFTDGSNTITAQWRDADGDGAGAPVVTDPSPLAANTTYSLSIELLNELESPPEDITEEIREEAEEHQFFFPTTGGILDVMIDDVESDYADNLEGDDLPVGLSSQVTTIMAGTGTLNVVLKHLPPLNDMPQKTGTNTILDGESDIDVTFDITVQ